MNQIWSSRVSRAAGTYAEHAPMATACCNACRTCATTNLVTLMLAAVTGAGYAASRLARRFVRTKP